MQKLAWLFQTDSARERCVRDESAKWAREHFAGPQETLARAVAYTLVSTLHVGFAQLTPATDIVRDLGADEWTEWAEIQMCLEQELGGEFALESRFEGSSIGELVEFASRHPTVPRAKKPKRPWTDWFSWRLSRHFNLKKPNQPPPAVDPNVQQKMPRFTQDQLKQVVVFGENDPDTEREIANLERKLGVRFPETYRHILALGGEAHMGPVPTAAAPELHFDFLPAERERFEFVSMKVATAHKRVLKSKSDMRAIIPFGALGNGDYVCFDYRGAPEPAIVLWNHEKAFSSPDPLLRIADSFDDFVASALKQRTSRQSPPR